METVRSLINNPEPIIEYEQSEDSSNFYYERTTGAIFINANETVWLWKEKRIEINVSLFYDYDKYNLFLMSTDMKKFDIYHTGKTFIQGANYINLINMGILPKRIEKGDLICVGYLVPKIESHIIKRTKNKIEEE